MVVGDHRKIVFWCQMGAQAGLMVQHYEVAALSSTPFSDSNAARIISARFAERIIPLLNSQAQYRGLIMYDTDAIPLPTPIYSTEGADSGTAGGDPLPGQVSGIITLRSTIAGRAGRGRKYVPFPGENDNDGSTGFPAPVVDYKDRLEDLAPLFGSSFVFEDPDNPGVTIDLDGVLYQDGDPTYFITSTVARRAWASQRRRGSYGRANIPPF